MLAILGVVDPLSKPRGGILTPAYRTGCLGRHPHPCIARKARNALFSVFGEFGIPKERKEPQQPNLPQELKNTGNGVFLPDPNETLAAVPAVFDVTGQPIQLLALTAVDKVESQMARLLQNFPIAQQVGDAERWKS